MPHKQADAVLRNGKSNSRAAYRRWTPGSAGMPKRIDAPENKKQVASETKAWRVAQYSQLAHRDSGRVPGVMTIAVREDARWHPGGRERTGNTRHRPKPQTASPARPMRKATQPEGR